MSDGWWHPRGSRLVGRRVPLRYCWCHIWYGPMSRGQIRCRNRHQSLRGVFPPPFPLPPGVWGGEIGGKGNPTRGYHTPPCRRGALILLHDRCASRDGGETVNVVCFILSIVKKAAMAQRGVGSCSLSPSPSGLAAEQVVKNLVLILSWL